MINYKEVNTHFKGTDIPKQPDTQTATPPCTPANPSAISRKLTKADKEIIADYMDYKIKEKIYELEDEEIDFVANSPFYHDDYFYEQARDLVLEELSDCADVDDYFDDEIPNATLLKNDILNFVKEVF